MVADTGVKDRRYWFGPARFVLAGFSLAGGAGSRKDLVTEGETKDEQHRARGENLRRL